MFKKGLIAISLGLVLSLLNSCAGGDDGAPDTNNTPTGIFVEIPVGIAD